MSDPASSSSLQTLSAELARLVADAAASVLAVHSHRSHASGFVWRPGLVVTADDPLAEEGEVAVKLPGGETKSATLAGRDSDHRHRPAAGGRSRAGAVEAGNDAA